MSESPKGKQEGYDGLDRKPGSILCQLNRTELFEQFW